MTTKSLAGSSSVGKDYLDSFKEKQNEKKTEGVFPFIVTITIGNCNYELNFDLNGKNEIYRNEIY